MKPRAQTLDFFFTPGGFQLDSPETGLSAEQARRLSPPGHRIYFHLVENNTKKDFPFRKSFQIHWQEY